MKKQTLANVDNKRWHFSNGLQTLYWIFLQFVRIRNSSSFMQQSAKFIPDQLLRKKPQRKS